MTFPNKAVDIILYKLPRKIWKYNAFDYFREYTDAGSVRMRQWLRARLNE